MIITLTSNPSWDKTAQLHTIHSPGLNRLTEVRTDLGGKGINVSKTLKALGIPSIVCAFGAKKMQEQLSNNGMEARIVFVPGETRTNLKIITPEGLTEFNEAGPNISPEKKAEMTALLRETMHKEDVLTISGKMAPGMRTDYYAFLIQEAKRAGCRTVLDADGEAFQLALEERPDVIKPNLYEFKLYFGLDKDPSLKEMVQLARCLDINMVVISMGKDGALFVTKDKACYAPGLPVDAKSSVGAGDSMTAALALSLDRDLDLDKTILLAMAASAGACLSDGTSPADLKTITELARKVTWTEL